MGRMELFRSGRAILWALAEASERPGEEALAGILRPSLVAEANLTETLPSWKWERAQPWTPCCAEATVDCRYMDLRRGSITVNLSGARLTSTDETPITPEEPVAGQAPDSTEALQVLLVFLSMTSGQVETPSAAGCRAECLLTLPTEDLDKTAAWALGSMEGLHLPPSHHSHRAVRMLPGGTSGTPPARPTPPEALLKGSAHLRTQGPAGGDIPGHRGSTEAHKGEARREVVAALVPQEAFAHLVASCIEVWGVVVLPLREEAAAPVEVEAPAATGLHPPTPLRRRLRILPGCRLTICCSRPGRAASPLGNISRW